MTDPCSFNERPLPLFSGDEAAAQHVPQGKRLPSYIKDHRKRLRDAAAFRALLEAEGIELVLHGHSHRSHHEILQTRDGPAPVIGVPSASSMRHEPGAYNLCRITPVAGGWEMTLTPRHLANQHVETGLCKTLSLERAHAAQ